MYKNKLEALKDESWEKLRGKLVKRKKVKRWEVKRNEKIEAQPPAMMMKRNVSGCLSTAPCCTEC